MRDEFDEFDDKTQPPTPRRRREARADGNVARSGELTAAVALVALLVLLATFGAALFKALQLLVRQNLSSGSLSQLNASSIARGALTALALVGGALAPLLIGIALVSVITNISQVGLLFSGKKIQPKLSNLNPFSGRLLPNSRNWISLATNILKLALVAALAYSAVRSRLGQIVAAQQLSFAQVFSAGCGVVFAVAIRVGGLLVTLAIFDYAHEKFRHERQLRMSRREVAEELKRTEGDPKVKSRRRHVAKHLVDARLQSDIRAADIIVMASNVAVALRYDAGLMESPRLVAKGAGPAADRIRQLAAAARIAIIERAALAKSLARTTDIGGEVPESSFSEIAELIAYGRELSA